MNLSITTLIVIVTVIASLIAENNYSLKERLVFSPYHITKYNQYYRFITSGFIHSGYLHLFFNMLTLYFFGNLVERSYSYLFKNPNGTYFYLILYFVGMIVANIPSYIKNHKSYSYSALGASGAVSAIVFAGIVLFPTQEIWFLPGFIFGPLYLFYSYYQSRYGNDNIGHDAHFFGALFGVLFTLVVFPKAVDNFIFAFQNYHFSLF